MDDLNLWDSILRSPSQQSTFSESTVLFAGTVSSNCTSILDTFCAKVDEDYDETDRDRGTNKDYPRIQPFSYRYFNVSDDFNDKLNEKDENVLANQCNLIDDAEALAHVNIWSIDEKFSSVNLNLAFNISKNSGATDRFALVIVIDLESNPEDCVKTLRAWMRRLREEVSAFSHDGDSEKYLMSARSLSGKIESADESTDSSSLLTFQKPYKVPLIVVASKSEVIRTDDAIAAKAARDLQGKLRSICLEAGAALIYTSTTEKTCLVNCGALQRYIAHRLYPDKIACTMGMQDGLANVRIPAGFDSTELIAISTGVDATTILSLFSERDDIDSAQVLFNGDNVESASSAVSEPTVSAESEAEWLGGLQTFLQQVTGESMVSTTEETLTPSRRMLSRPPVPHEDEEEVRSFFRSLLASTPPSPLKMMTSTAEMSPSTTRG